jgi:flagellar biosynthesis protein
MSEEQNQDQPLKRVVGLQYEPGQGLPQVILKGSGKIAEEIVRRGDRGSGPTVVQDAGLVDQLYRLPIDARIGPELFHLVAALLAHVFTIEQKLKGRSHD